MLQIAICEDEKEQALWAEKLILSGVPELHPQVRSFPSAEDMLCAVRRSEEHTSELQSR